MKRRSVGGFVTGLIGLLIGLPVGFYAYFVLALILSLSNHSFLAYSVYSFFAAAIFAIIAVCFYFSKARVGGILMLIATILYLVPFACGLYVILINDGISIELMFVLAIGNIPTLLIFISALLGLTARVKEKFVPYTPFQQPPQMPPFSF